MSDRVKLLTPVGRLVQGSLYRGSSKDADGNPLVFKSGENIGQPRLNYFFSLAIPKDGRDWKQTEWGQLIYGVAVAAFPKTVNTPTFAWKVEDGDSTVPNQRGASNNQREGFPGNWIVKFSGSFAPKVFREDNGAYVQVTEENYIKAGYYVQVSGSVGGNGSIQRPGLFLNPEMVCFTAYGQEIHFGPDANSVGFGKAPLPAGALPTPVASSVPLPASVPPAPPAYPPMEPAQKMTAKAAGSSYQAFKTAGWTDEALVAQGYMTI